MEGGFLIWRKLLSPAAAIIYSQLQTTRGSRGFPENCVLINLNETRGEVITLLLKRGEGDRVLQSSLSCQPTLRFNGLLSQIKKPDAHTIETASSFAEGVYEIASKTGGPRWNTNAFMNLL